MLPKICRFSSEFSTDGRHFRWKEEGKRKEHSDIQILLCGSQFPGGTFLLASEATVGRQWMIIGLFLLYDSGARRDP